MRRCVTIGIASQDVFDFPRRQTDVFYTGHVASASFSDSLGPFWRRSDPVGTGASGDGK